jgi:hypothetical protein
MAQYWEQRWTTGTQRDGVEHCTAPAMTIRCRVRRYVPGAPRAAAAFSMKDTVNERVPHHKRVPEYEKDTRLHSASTLDTQRQTLITWLRGQEAVFFRAQPWPLQPSGSGGKRCPLTSTLQQWLSPASHS